MIEVSVLVLWHCDKCSPNNPQIVSGSSTMPTSTMKNLVVPREFDFAWDLKNRSIYNSGLLLLILQNYKIIEFRSIISVDQVKYILKDSTNILSSGIGVPDPDILLGCD